MLVRNLPFWDILARITPLDRHGFLLLQITSLKDGIGSRWINTIWIHFQSFLLSSSCLPSLDRFLMQSLSIDASLTLLGMQ